MKFDIRVFFKNVSRICKCHSNLTRITGTLHKDQYTFFISRPVIRRMNKTGSVSVTQQWGEFVPPLLQWKINRYYTTEVCVFVPLGIQHAMHMCHIVICVLPRSKTFFHVVSQTTRFLKKKNWTWNVWFEYLYNFCLLYFFLFFTPISPTAFNVQSPLHNLGRSTVPSYAFDHVTHFVQFAKFAKHTQPTLSKVLRFTHTSQYFEIVGVWKR